MTVSVSPPDSLGSDLGSWDCTTNPKIQDLTPLHGVAAVVLGGGRGRRMGGNKLFLAAGGRLVVEQVLVRIAPWFEEVILAVGAEDRERIGKILGPILRDLKVKIVVDREPGRGPLEGLAVGLEAVTTGWAFLLGCDMPQVQEVVVRALWRARKRESGVVCARLNGFLEPLHAFYSAGCLPEVRRALEQGTRKLKGFYHAVDVTVVEEDALSSLAGYRKSFQGINTPEDLRRFMG